jgi:hypothetical protein
LWASYLNDAANQGYNVILSSPWYLNTISYGKYNTNTSVMNLEFFKYYEIEPLRKFNGKLFGEYISQCYPIIHLQVQMKQSNVFLVEKLVFGEYLWMVLIYFLGFGLEHLL